MIPTSLTDTFTTSLSGFHVYSDNWKTYLRHHLQLNNPHNCFAVVENTMLPGKICQETVDHVPSEMSH